MFIQNPFSDESKLKKKLNPNGCTKMFINKTKEKIKMPKLFLFSK